MYQIPTLIAFAILLIPAFAGTAESIEIDPFEQFENWAKQNGITIVPERIILNCHGGFFVLFILTGFDSFNFNSLLVINISHFDLCNYVLVK